MDKTFTCYLCKRTFNKQNDEEWNDAKKLEEMLTLHPECKDHSYDSVCDNCFQMIEEWLSTLTDEQKRQILDSKNEL